MTGIHALPSITVRRDIEASAEELFDAWLDPEAIAVWMCPPGIAQTVAHLDARVGGAFELVMNAAEASFRHVGIYQRIDRPRQLVFTWVSAATNETESLVTVDFKVGTSAERTVVIVTHERLPNPGAVTSHATGWGTVLERLAAFHSA